MANRLFELEREISTVRSRTHQSQQKLAKAKSKSKGPNIIQRQLSQLLVDHALDPQKGPIYYDPWVWEMTIKYPTYPWQATLLKKIFTVLRKGRLVYRTQKTNHIWNLWDMPLASALSHGGRVIIQYPSKTGFWSWLKDGVELESRTAATHGMKKHPDGKEMVTFDPEVGGRQTRDKFYVEQKYSGINKVKSVKIRKDYGVNLPMGGDSNVKDSIGIRLLGTVSSDELPREVINGIGTITSNGQYGHLYIYHRGTMNGHSIVMIGLESSGSGSTSIMGKVHDASGSAGLISGAYGVKFTHPSFNNINHPDDYDSMFVGLDANWAQTIGKDNVLTNWSDAWLGQPVP